MVKNRESPDFRSPEVGRYEDVRAQKDALENLSAQDNIKKDSNRYFAEKI